MSVHQLSNEECEPVASMPYESQLVQPAIQEDQAEGLDLLGFIRRRKAFVLIFALMGIGIAYMMFQRESPQYRSDALVHVIHHKSDPRLTSMVAEQDLTDADYVLKAPKTLGAAFRNNGLGELPTFYGLGEEDAVARMSGMLSTKKLTVNVVQVFATGSNPTDVQKLVQAASEEYVAAQRENYKDASEDLRKLFMTAKDELMVQISEAEAAYSKFRASSQLNADGDNPYRATAKSAQEKISAFELQKTELKAQLAQLEDAVARGGDREAILLLVEQKTENPAASGKSLNSGSPQDIAQALFPLLKEEAELANKLGPDHPSLKTIRMQIKMTRDHLKNLAGLAQEESAAKEGPKPPDFLTIYLQSLREELKIIERQQNDMKVYAAAEELKARALLQEEIEDEHRKSEKARLTKLFDETTLQISEIQVNAGMGGITAQVLQPARYGNLVYPILPRFLALGAFLGAFVGLGLGYLVEIADRSFRKPEDIIREFGVPIIGHVPFMTEQRLKSIPQGSPMARVAVSVHLPRSRPAEAYRGVRTAICFSALGGTHRVLSVTSPAAGDGKSTLALNLALSLAQSGKKTILVESDFRRPKVHKLTGVDNAVGFVDVLRGDADLNEAIKETEVNDFCVLPCGKRPSDPAELLARPQYEQLLQTLRQRFEYVIIDTPPVLAVTDPCGVAARVDGVIICMRLSRHTRDLGRRTVEQLRDIGATVSGIVINGIEERDAYGYGNYRYSDYRYHYKNYNYNYGQYGNKDSGDYYADENQSDLTPAASEKKSKALS